MSIVWILDASDLRLQIPMQKSTPQPMQTVSSQGPSFIILIVKLEKVLDLWNRRNETGAGKLYHATTHSSSCAFRLAL